MRFLILTQYFHPEIGAPQLRLAATIRELLRLGHTVEVVTTLPNYPQGQIFADYRRRFYIVEDWEGVRVHRVWLYAATGAGIKRLWNYFSFMVTAWWALRKAQKPDFLFVESPPLFLGITAYLTAKRWQIPFILNVADLWPDFVRGVGLMKKGYALKFAEKLEAWLYQRANWINVVTEGMREILIQNKQVPPSKVLFLPNGVDTQIFYPQIPDEKWRVQLNLPNRPFVLYAGTHGYAHGMEVILETAELLADTEIQFLFVGGGSEKATIEQLSQQKQLNNVTFWPPQSPAVICRLYSFAVAGLATLRDSADLESMRLAKILAIMACGKPVLYSGGAGEGARLITTAQAGIVVPPQQPVALAQAIRELVADPRQASQLGSNGRIYVEKHLQWSTVIKRWLQQLQPVSLK